MRGGAAGLGLVLVAGVVALGGAQEAPTKRVPPAPADFDLHEIRNIFRFADVPAASPGTDSDVAGEPDRVEPPASAPGVAKGPRLVGLVRRADRLVAAVAVEGEVVLLAEGQSVAGFTVTGINEEGIRLRGPGGEDSTLRLP